MKKIILLVITIVSSGCLVKNNIGIEYPKWYLNNDKDSATYLNGVGNASSKKAAILMALYDIASKITVSIESSYSVTTKIKNDNYSQNIDKNIKATVEKINFRNYKITNEAILNNNQYIVAIKVNKIALANEIMIKVNNKIEQSKQILDTDYKNRTYKLKKMNKIINIIPKLKSELFIANSLDKMLKVDSVLKTIDTLENKINTMKNNITVNISSSHNRGYSKILSSIITKKGFILVNKVATLNIVINSIETKINSMGNKIIKSDLEIIVYNKTKSIILAKKRIVSGGSSNSSFRQAREFAISYFKSKIIDENILSDMLGI